MAGGSSGWLSFPSLFCVEFLAVHLSPTPAQGDEPEGTIAQREVVKEVVDETRNKDIKFLVFQMRTQKTEYMFALRPKDLG